MATHTKAPGTVASDSRDAGTEVWGNANNAKALDGSFADVNTAGGVSDSEYLLCSNYGFSLLGESLAGIQVTIHRKVTEGVGCAGSCSAADRTVKLVNEVNVLEGSNKAAVGDWPTVLAAKVYGGAADIWGTTLNSTDVEDSDFGVALDVDLDGTDDEITAEVDYVEITVTTVAGTGTDGASAFIYLLCKLCLFVGSGLGSRILNLFSTIGLIKLITHRRFPGTVSVSN